MDRIVIVATSTVDPITENISLGKIKDYWCFDIPMSFGELARKSIEGIPIDIRQQMESLIFCTLSSDEKSRAQIYADIANGKSRSKPSVVLEAAGLNTRISLCGDLDVNPDIYNVQAACATGLKALELGMMTARLKDQVVVVGSCDKMTTDFNLTFFNSLGAISKGEVFTGPFDKNRSGFAMGVGSAFIALCTESKAKHNNWQPIAYIDSIISCTKPVHPTNPSDIEFIANLVKQSISESLVSLEDIGHWNAHATCTPMGDDLEYQTYLKIIGDRNIPISSLKGAIGHTMGPSGLIETIHGINKIKNHEVFSNDRLHNPIVDDDRILRNPVTTNKKSFIKTSFGFGGRNSVGIFTVI